MGTRSASAALTESRGGPASAGASLYVGVDVGRHHHLVAAIPRGRMEDGSWEQGAVRRFATNSAGYRELLDWLEGSGLPAAEVKVGCEPTGGWYSRTVVAYLETYGYRIDWLQNWAVHDRRQLLIGKQTKTDALDARLIARLLYERDLMGSVRGFLHRPPQHAEGLRMMVRNRLKLVNFRTRYRLQLGAVEDVLFPELKHFFRARSTGRTARILLEHFPTPAHLAAASDEELAGLVIREARALRLARRLPELRQLAANSAGLSSDVDQLLRVQSWLLRQLRTLEEEVEAADHEVATALEAWPGRDRAVLQSFPNMSILREAILLSTIGDVSSYRSDRQLRKLLGWYPEAAESGSSVYRHRLGQKGNRLARREIWLWVIGLLSPHRESTPFRLYYQRLRGRGLAGNVAVGHVAGKLISVLFACLRKREAYDACRHARELGRGDS